MRLTKKLIPVMAVFSFVLAACSISTGSAADSQKININLSLYKTKDSSQNVYRTAFPGDTKTIAGSLHYVVTAYSVPSLESTETSDSTLYYRASEDSTLLYLEVDYEDLKSSTGINIALSPAIWRITLSAYTSEIIPTSRGLISNTDIALTDTQVIDISNKKTASVEKLVFSLKLPETTTATGSLQVGLAFCPPDTFARISWGLYNADSTLVSGTSKAYSITDAAFTASQVFTAEANDEEGFSKRYYAKDGISLTNLLAGRYTFAISFEDSLNRIGYYQSDLQIDGGNITKMEITLRSATFNSTPRNISGLQISSYKFNNKEITSSDNLQAKMDKGIFLELTDNASTIKSFSATFDWIDQADNEAGYKIQVSENSGSSWDDLETSLPAGTQSYTHEFDTGKTYKIRVKPYNSRSSEGSTTSGFDQYVESDEFGLFTVSYALTDTAGKDCTVQKTTASVTDFAIKYFVVPYVYAGGSDINALIQSTGQTPYINIPEDYDSTYNLSWEKEANPITSLEENTENLTLIPVFSAS